MPFVNNNGWQIWYEEEGQGEPLILCGGPMMLHDQFGRSSSLLAKHFRILNWNWRGMGNSSRNWMAGMTFDHWIDDLVTVMDAAGIEKAHFWGISSGSLFAIRLASRYPDRVDKLVLYPSITGPKSDIAKFKARIALEHGIEQTVWSGFWLAGSTESFEDGSIVKTALHEIEIAKRHMTPNILARANLLYADLDLTPDVMGLKAPILMLLGASGRLGAEAPAIKTIIDRYRSAFPEMEVVTIRRTGGTMAAVEAPEACAKAVRAFLTKEKPAALRG